MNQENKPVSLAGVRMVAHLYLNDLNKVLSYGIKSENLVFLGIFHNERLGVIYSVGWTGVESDAPKEFRDKVQR